MQTRRAGRSTCAKRAALTREVSDHAGKFLSASKDGSKILLDDGCLYDVVGESCEDLSEGEGGFLGLVGQSEDLSHVYFVDTAALTEPAEENANGEHAEAGKNNLYAWAQGGRRRASWRSWLRGTTKESKQQRLGSDSLRTDGGGEPRAAATWRSSRKQR